MKKDFEKILATIDSITDLNHVETCNIMIKKFNKTHLADGHSYAMNLLGYLQATIKHKLG